MYHDEFGKKPAWVKPGVDVDLPGLPMGVGGGLCLSLVASFQPTISALLFGLGGLVPLVVSCGAIALHRGSVALGGLVPSLPIECPRNPPAPHLATLASASRRGTSLRRVATGPTRTRLEASRPSRPD